MSLIDMIRAAGVVGCGGAGFPTHAKLACRAETLILNGAECEPLLRTDRYIMKNKSRQIVAAMEMMAEHIGAGKLYLALKENYKDEIASLIAAIGELGSRAQLFLMGSFYPAGSEQSLVLDVTGRTVPPGGIPPDVGVVVSNVATAYQVYEAAQGRPFTHRYLTVTGEVPVPSIVCVPLGTPIVDCIAAAGGILTDNFRIIAGGPLMGKLLDTSEAKNAVVTKTLGGLILLPEESPLTARRETPLHSVLRRGKTACIQCSFCTEMCPGYLSGHPLQPHRIMRKMAYADETQVLWEDEDIRQSLICCECGICEAYACPMELSPRRVLAYLKGQLREAGIRYSKPNLPVFSREGRESRRVPSKRLASRLGISKYYNYEINELRSLTPERVMIPLMQHIGAPAVPVVKEGDAVVCGQLIGACPDKALGAAVHASIDGVVVDIGDRIVIEGRRH